ncbi:MAG: co-chaperone GroES [Bacillota bacterium]|nr:co-chaperone GroES [Bacillota bacterium]
MKIRPIGERVVIKKLEAEQKTASGIVLPGAAQEQPQLAEVLEVPEAEDVKIKKGDKVIYKQYAGTEVKLDDVSYIVIDLEHILAVVE